jgi:hypothetical protein
MNFYPHRIPCLFTFVPLLIHSFGLTIDNSNELDLVLAPIYSLQTTAIVLSVKPHDNEKRDEGLEFLPPGRPQVVALI